MHEEAIGMVSSAGVMEESGMLEGRLCESAATRRRLGYMRRKGLQFVAWRCSAVGNNRHTDGWRIGVSG
ncbi:unnamed protein product [Dovyalis caffra]|uniref:Uncharacterized protein n=1 Tax=Dovyalis caffra TaxID=77055 RepID=A0AAV1SIN4_9ROSI|nr:unnamed protein product [Dovyalis caffra]